MIRVVAGVLRYREMVLTAWRGTHQHAGSCWEFPGGKVRTGESCAEALRREFYEETGARTSPGLPVICLQHEYADRRILLDVREVMAVRQTVRARQRQFLRWYPLARLHKRDFPAANGAVIDALKLPHLYALTPPLTELGQVVPCIRNLIRRLSGQPHLIALRAPQLKIDAATVECAAALVHAAGAQLMLHDRCDLTVQFASRIAGVHLSQSAFKHVLKRPVGPDQWFAVSCHSLNEIAQAAAKGADFCVLSPVRNTSSHPGFETLGVDAFAKMAQQADIPVFALGGMHPDDVVSIRRCGGQGIAGIRCFQGS